RKKTVPPSHPTPKAWRGGSASALRSSGTRATQASPWRSKRGNARASAAPPSATRAAVAPGARSQARQSGATLEPVGEKPRKPGRHDLPPGFGEIVRHASDRHSPGGAVPDRVGGARVPVPRLPDAADVHDVRVGPVQRKVDRARPPGGPPGADGPVAGQVGMPDERERRVKRREGGKPLRGRQDVLPRVWVPRARVDERRLPEAGRQRQAGEPAALVVGKGPRRP